MRVMNILFTRSPFFRSVSVVAKVSDDSYFSVSLVCFDMVCILV